MLRYQRINAVDDELERFHLKQKNYYSYEGIIPTKDYIIEDMKGPAGFSESDHYIYKVYLDDVMIALIDFQYGYRFSLRHDDKCVWIGLFLVDESYQRRGFGKEIINHFMDKYQQICNRVQLACIKNNELGFAFWRRCGFNVIASSEYKELTTIVLEKRI